MYYPLLPSCLDAMAVWDYLRQRNPLQGWSDIRIRKSLQTFLRKDVNNRNRYVWLMLYIGKETQKALDDLSTRKRVATSRVHDYICDPFLRDNGYYLNTTYLDNDEVIKVWRILTGVKQSVAIHIHAMEVPTLKAYLDTYVEQLAD